MWAPPSQISQGSYALDIVAKTLSNYEKFFKIPFPLPKEGNQLTSAFNYISNQCLLLANFRILNLAASAPNRLKSAALVSRNKLIKNPVF